MMTPDIFDTLIWAIADEFVATFEMLSQVMLEGIEETQPLAMAALAK